jgi:hypothetical protein
MLEKNMKQRLKDSRFVFWSCVFTEAPCIRNISCKFFSFLFHICGIYLSQTHAYTVYCSYLSTSLCVLTCVSDRICMSIGPVVPVSYSTKCFNPILEIRAKGWKRIIGEPVGRWNQYHGDDWSHGHPTSSAIGWLNWPAYIVIRITIGHVVKFKRFLKIERGI